MVCKVINNWLKHKPSECFLTWKNPFLTCLRTTHPSLPASLVPYPDEPPAGALLQHTHVLLADGGGSFPVDAHSGGEAEPFPDAADGLGVARVPHHGEADGVIGCLVHDVV